MEVGIPNKNHDITSQNEGSVIQNGTKRKYNELESTSPLLSEASSPPPKKQKNDNRHAPLPQEKKIISPFSMEARVPLPAELESNM